MDEAKTVEIIRSEVDQKIRQIGRVMVDYTSELLFPRNMAKYIRENTAFTDDEILDLLQAIDEQYIKRFGMNPYDKLMKDSMKHSKSRNV